MYARWSISPAPRWGPTRRCSRSMLSHWTETASVQYGLPPAARTTAEPRSRYGLTVVVVKNARGIRIDLRAARLRFKYLSWRWVTEHHLVIDMWKSAPPVSGRREPPWQGRLPDSRQR